MRRCFGFDYRPLLRIRTSSRASVSTEANGKSTASADESRGEGEGGEPSSSSSSADSSSATTLRLSSLEYQRIVNSFSFKETLEKINAADGEASIQEVLRPDTASVEAALRRVKTNPLKQRVSEYFEHSEQACRLCLTLQDKIKTVRGGYRILRDTLDALPSSAEGGPTFRLSQSQCEDIYDVFQKFVHYKDAFDPNQAGMSNLDELPRQFEDLNDKLQRLLRKAEVEGLRLQQATWGSALCLVVATMVLAAVGLAVAAHAAVTLLAGSPALLVPCCFFSDDGACDPLGPRRRRLKGRKALVSDAERGTLVRHQLRNIDALVKDLHNTMKKDADQVDFVLQGRRGDHHALELVISMLCRDKDRVFDGLDELGSHICIFCIAANQSRQLLYDHIRSSSSLGTTLQGELGDDDNGESSSVDAVNGIA